MFVPAPPPPMLSFEEWKRRQDPRWKAEQAARSANPVAWRLGDIADEMLRMCDEALAFDPLQKAVAAESRYWPLVVPYPSLYDTVPRMKTLKGPLDQS